MPSQCKTIFVKQVLFFLKSKVYFTFCKFYLSIYKIYFTFDPLNFPVKKFMLKKRLYYFKTFCL